MLNMSLANVPKSIDPTEAWSYQHFLLIQAVFDTLVRVNEAGRIVASVARKWSVDGSGRIYTMELQPNARFHDGKAVESEDVAFSIAKHFWPGSKSVVKVYLEGILTGSEQVAQGQLPSGIKIIGKHALSFSLVAPYPPFLSVLAMPGFSIFPKNADLHARPIGSGPMRASFSEETNSWQLVRFDDYVGIPPKTVSFSVQRRTSVDDVLSSFKNGTLDIAIGVPFSDLDPATVPSGVKVLQTNSLVSSHLYLNPDNVLLKNRDFRRDLAMLIYSVADRQDLISVFQEFSPFFMPKGILPAFYYERHYDKITADDFKKKWGTAAQSRGLKIILLQTYFSKGLLKALSDVFNSAGLTTSVQAMSGPDLNTAFDNHDFDIAGMPYVGNFPDPDGFLELLHDGSGFKKGFAPSKRLFSDLQKIRFVPDATKRLKAYADTLLKFEDQWYVIPIFRVNLPILHANGVRIPDTSYHYEAELKNIFWQVEERR